MHDEMKLVLIAYHPESQPLKGLVDQLVMAVQNRVLNSSDLTVQIHEHASNHQCLECSSADWELAESLIKDQIGFRDNIHLKHGEFLEAANLLSDSPASKIGQWLRNQHQSGFDLVKLWIYQG